MKGRPTVTRIDMRPPWSFPKPVLTTPGWRVLTVTPVPSNCFASWYVLFTYQLAKQLEGTGVTVNTLHPGVVITGFGKDQGGLMSILITVSRPFMISPDT